jgi:hypothetical protein
MRFIARTERFGADSRAGEGDAPMATHCFRSSKPDEWTLPRPMCDPSARLRAYGPVRPMAEDAGFLSRLFAR